MGIKITGINQVIRKNKEFIEKAVEKELRTKALKALADVKLQTPIDTGRARNSWYIGYQARFIDGTVNDTINIQVLTPQKKPTKIIVTNGTSYIEFLNNGHSQQAPTRFIEAAFRKHFDKVNVEIVKINRD